MDASDLRVFEAVVRRGGMKRAADDLSTVQSNVTARIQSLEHDLGVRLFDRHSRGATPTAAGLRLLPYARRMTALLAEARRAASDAGQPAGRLVVGSLETTAALRLSRPLADYVSHYPDVDLVLRTGTTMELLQRVLDGELEGAFVCGPVDHPQLEARAVFREELVLATPSTSPTMSDLAGIESLRLVVLRAGCSYRQRLEDILARRGLLGLRRLEFGTIEAIVGCVAGGLGVTLMPRGIVAPAAEEGRLAIHTLPVDDAVVDTVFVHRRDAHVSSALHAFVDSVTSMPALAAE